MNYTEKEKKGLDKVEKMNHFFDRVLIPAIGVLIILTLLSFIVSGIMDKFGGGENGDTSSVLTSENSNEVSDIFRMRTSILDGYTEHIDEFEAYGYNTAEGYSQDIALCKVVDEEMLIYQFRDSSLGDFTILRYTPSNEVNAEFNYLSMTISSDTLVNVAVNNGDYAYKVTFTSTDFSSYSSDDGKVYNSMMNIISIDELNAMYEIFETDIKNLAQTCGIST